MFGANYFGARYFGPRYFGKEGLTVPGYYWGNYFGRVYFGPRYFGKQGDSAPFVATVSTGASVAATGTFSTVTVTLTAPMTATVNTGLSASCTGSINATPVLVLGEDFVAGQPLALECAATCTLLLASVDIGYAVGAGTGRHFGGRYFGPHYYGPNYWGTQIEFEATVTAGLTCGATGTIAGAVSQVLIATTSGVIACAATASIAADAVPGFATPPPEPFGGGWLEIRPARKRQKRKIDEPVAEETVQEPSVALGVEVKGATEPLGQEVVKTESDAQKRAKRKARAEERARIKRQQADDELLLM
jgi:hypothetical protein